MTVSEMELVGQLGRVEPLPDEAFDKARAVLQAAVTVEDARAALGLAHPHRGSRRPVLVGSGIFTAIAAAAAAVAVVATSTAAPTDLPASPRHVGARYLASPHVPARSSQVASPLVRLADFVSRSGAPTGNATLVVRTTALGGGRSVTVYDLYADNGQVFFSRTEGALPGQVRADHHLAGGLFAREIAAAKLAVAGNLRTAGEDMAAAPDPGKYVPQVKTETINAADAAKEPGVYHAGQVIGTDYDNYVWENSQDALIAGSGDPQVRAGVLRLLATLPDLTVTSGTSGGQPTLVLTAGADETEPGGTEQLTINATTGIPISSASSAPGQALTTAVTYQVSRVTTGDIAAGKF
jgi:hypothetical protein